MAESLIWARCLLLPVGSWPARIATLFLAHSMVESAGLIATGDPPSLPLGRAPG